MPGSASNVTMEEQDIHGLLELGCGPSSLSIFYLKLTWFYGKTELYRTENFFRI